MRRLFIINPKSGNGTAAKKWPGYAGNPAVTEWQWTDAPGHARRLASEAADSGFESVVAVGGDGTVNEVIDGILETPLEARPSLGILPGGTGDDFARSLGCPLDWNDALASICAGGTRMVDIGSATGGFGIRAFGIAAFVGAATQMASDANERGKVARGIWGYLPFLARAARFRSVVGVDTDSGSWRGPALSVLVANAPRGGGGIHVCPPAALDDGLLDVVVVEAIPLLHVVRVLIALARGRHLNLPFVHHWKCRTATLSGENVALALDGEIVGELPVELSVLPGALRVIVSAS